MIVRAAVVPYPPLMVPELVGSDVPETRAVRAASLAAASALTERSRRWIAVAPGVGEVGPAAVGTFRGFGVDVPVRLDEDTEGDFDPAMPLPVLIAGWLREQAGARAVSVHLVAPDATSAECQHIGARIANDLDGPVGLLVLGDGSPRHGEHAPTRPDERAEEFDRNVHMALSEADPEALLAIDQQLAAELDAAGRVAWQVLAGTGKDWTVPMCELLVPFGVGYHVAVWDPVVP